MNRSRARTYTHLAGGRRIPSDYEITSTDLHWYVQRGYGTQVPLAGWVAEHQRGSPLQASWGAFVDPRQTTYLRYVALQRNREVYVDGLFEDGDPGRPGAPPPAAIDLFERSFVPMRHAWHGLQMVAAYVGHLAPEGRITICAAFEAADLVRRVQRISERTARLWPGRGAEVVARARTAWEQEPAWQPLRRVVERLLVTWDWGEAFVALNLMIGPALDVLLLREAARRAREAGDPSWAGALGSFDEDGQWHGAWSGALVDVAFADRPANRAVVDQWVERWRPGVEEAVDAMVSWLDLDASARTRALAATGARR